MSDEREILDLVIGKLDGVTSRYGGSYMAKCPAHEDRTASLSIGLGTDQPVVLMCQAGCATDTVLSAIGLVSADICATREDRPAATGEWTPHGEATAVYTYTDEDGKTLYEVMRTPGKQFPVRVPDPLSKSGWRWRLGETRRVLYRLPRLRAAIDDGLTIFVVEGEKDVHSVERAGGVATCNPGGAGKWNPDFTEALRDAMVVIVADADKPGRAHAHMIAAALEGVAATVEIREAADGKDVTDHLASGRTLDELVVTAGASPDTPAELAMDLLTFVEEADPAERWVIPHLLERGDRLIWTGWEGLGKSMAVRQIGVAAAAGVQPFISNPADPSRRYDPQRVLFIDCENRVRRSRRYFRTIVGVCNAKFRQIEPGMFRIVHRPDGINLLSAEDAAFVLERVTAYQPDLLIIGPLYKLHDIDANEEQSARAIVRALEAAISVCGSALIVEAHAGHAGTGATRSLRPRGSSLFMGWPDYGFGIRKADEKGDKRRVEVVPWRGPRDDNDWPRELMWGSSSEFPWVPSTPPAPVTRSQPPPPRYPSAPPPLPDFHPEDEDDGWGPGTNGSAANR